MPHQLIPTKKLHFQDGYNIRTDKEVRENAKAVAAHMELLGDNAEAFPVRYVEIDGKLFTRNHATLLAAQERGWKEVYAIESQHKAGSVEDLLDLVISNNQGHPISRVKQGELYKRLRDGEPAEPETVKNGKVGEEVPMLREPMTLEAIGKLMKPAYTRQHVSDCVTLHDSSPEIRELLESDAIASNSVITAYQWSKGDDAKALKICRAAIKAAEARASDKATKQDMDTIKDQFVELKADDGTKKKGKNKGASTSSGPAAGSEAGNGDNAPELPAGDNSEPGETPETQSELFANAVEATTEGSKKNTKLREAWTTILMEPDNLEDCVLESETVAALVEKLHAAMIAARDVF